MDEAKKDGTDLRPIIQGVIEEFVRAQQIRAEPAYKAELLDERKRREDLERRMNDLVQENQRSRQMAEEADRSMSIRTELQRLGVAKVDLAYRAVKDDIQRGEDGRLTAKGGREKFQCASIWRSLSRRIRSCCRRASQADREWDQRRRCRRVEEGSIWTRFVWA